MKKDKSSERSWLERLGQFLSSEPQDQAQLLQILRDAEQRQLLDAEALSMIEGALQVAKMQARDIMVPRSQVITIAHDAKPSTFLPTVIESAHSRFPIIDRQREEVIGILLAKSLLTTSLADDVFDLEEIMLPATFVPESKRLNILLKEFRSKRNHMAIVVDEYGSFAGIVTIEDVLEQIVGDIEDEFDVDEEAYIKQHHDGEYIVKAVTPIEEFNDYFSANLSDKQFDTIGGLIVHDFGYLPKPGEKIRFGEFMVEIMHADHRRIRLLKLTRLPISS